MGGRSVDRGLALQSSTSLAILPLLRVQPGRSLSGAVFIPRTAANSHHAERLAGLARKLIVPISPGSLYGFLMSSLITLFPLYLKQMNVDEGQMGSIITAVIGGTLISQVPIGRAADRFGKRRTLVICSLVLASRSR